MSFSNYLEDALLTWAFTDDAAPTRPTAWYVSLHTASPGETGANELVVGTSVSYARVAVTGGFSTPTGGDPTEVSNSGAIVFTNTDGSDTWETANYFGVWDSLTTGNFLGGGDSAFSTGKTLGPGDTATFAIGALVIAQT